jgi:predicted Holliday junction resolvase-like endonuclease
MIISNSQLSIFFLIGIIVLLMIFISIQKDIRTIIDLKLKNLELDDSYINEIRREKNEIDNINQNRLNNLIAERKQFFINDAIRRSGSVTKGKVIEHFAPFLLFDTLNPDEIVFMGSPVDLISFTNIDSTKDLSIDFLEIKSGNATLNKKQRLIRNAINSNRIYYKKVELK